MGAFVQPQNNTNEIAGDRRSVQAAGPGEIHPGPRLWGLGQGHGRGIPFHARPGGERRNQPGPRPDPDHQPPRLWVQSRGTSGKAGHRPCPPAPSGCAFFRGYRHRPSGDPRFRDRGPPDLLSRSAFGRSSEPPFGHPRLDSDRSAGKAFFHPSGSAHVSSRDHPGGPDREFPHLRGLRAGGIFNRPEQHHGHFP